MKMERTQPIEVAGGKISGYCENGINVYKGIPYAAPPVGALRWKAPQPPQNWDGVKECIEWKQSPL